MYPRRLVVVAVAVAFGGQTLASIDLGILLPLVSILTVAMVKKILPCHIPDMK